ncbi:MAG: NUDIX domain-containing protein, partial [Burkholderiales bacterium]
MAKKSAGILPYRRSSSGIEVLLGHPGGPFWANKDDGAWSILKGEFEDEEPLAAAKREFEEETGFAVDGEFIALTPLRQKSGKTNYFFAL